MCKRILCILLSLVLPVSLLAGCTVESEPPTPPRVMTVEEEIIYDYYYTIASVEFRIINSLNSISLRFRGTFSDTYVVFVDGSFDYEDVSSYDAVSGYLFLYPTSQKMLAYHQGTFYSLKEAYDAGFLTLADIQKLYNTHLNIGTDLSERGEVPTQWAECTHTPPEPPIDSTPPVTVTQPTTEPATEPTTEPTMEPTTAPTTEPIDWNVLLPDIPAVTEPAAKPEVMNTEALVYTLYDYTLVWNDSQGKNKQITFQIPAIVPFCEGAIEINEAIRKAFQYDVVAARTCYEMQWSTSTVGIYYAVSLHDNVLSIRTFETTIVFGTEERHWALDLTTGKQLSTQGFAEKYLQESYPVFLEHCTHNLIQWFAANPLSDPNQQDRLMKCLANEVHAIGAYTLYLDFDGTLTLDLQIDAFRINGITYSTINDDSWVGDTASGYHWLFALKTDGEYGDHKARLLLDSFFADPTEFVTMLSEEEAATILDIADSLNYGLSPQDMDRYRQLCDDIYTVSPKDSKIAVTASILYRIAQPL